MKIGDLVEFIECGSPPSTPSHGIIVRGPIDGWSGNNAKRRWEIRWYTCGNEGWWEEKYLGVISEGR